MINTVRSEESPVILVDCGGFFSNRIFSSAGKMLADFTLKATNVMGYAAMNISPGEFSFGVDFLRDHTSGLTFPLVASNLSYAEGISPFTKRYVIVQAGDRKVAILGVMPPGILDNMPRSGASGVVEVLPAAEALTSILTRIRAEVDIVILLSQMGFVETQRLMDTVKGIDVAIYGGKDNVPAGCGSGAGTGISVNGPRAPVFKANAKGSHLGYIRLSVDDTGRVAVARERMIFLDESVPMDDRILAITGEDVFQLVAEERKKEAEKMKRNIAELHKLTPEEYMQKLLSEQKGETAQ